jgi:formamidopyrimidine-DNA glycosylase
VREFLTERVVGERVESATVLRPTVLRPLAAGLVPDIEGRIVESIERRGKFVFLHFSSDRALVINPKLTGAVQYCTPKARVYKRTCVVLSLSNEQEVRYLDDRQMGIAYYARRDQMGEIPRLEQQGPDVLSDFSFEEFQHRLRPFYGEIKGILTRGRVVAGIGNAYSDEILFAAKVYPFRKRKKLSQDELHRIYQGSREVAEGAVRVLRERMGGEIHVKVRDFLQVHNKGGLPCPRCGNAITQVTANQRITSYCRRCQPGMLISN